MKKYFDIVKDWIIDRWESGMAWDMFLLGLVFMITLILGLVIFT